MMRRRDFITLIAGGAAAWPRAARAQQAGKLWRIGFVSGAVRPPALERSIYAGLSHGMRQLGYVEGKDFVIEYRFAEGKYERFDDFAGELVRLKADALPGGKDLKAPKRTAAKARLPSGTKPQWLPVGVTPTTSRRIATRNLPRKFNGWMSAAYHCHECEMRVMAYLRLR